MSPTFFRAPELLQWTVQSKDEKNRWSFLNGTHPPSESSLSPSQSHIQHAYIINNWIEEEESELQQLVCLCRGITFFVSRGLNGFCADLNKCLGKARGMMVLQRGCFFFFVIFFFYPSLPSPNQIEACKEREWVCVMKHYLKEPVWTVDAEMFYLNILLLTCFPFMPI